MIFFACPIPNYLILSSSRKLKQHGITNIIEALDMNKYVNNSEAQNKSDEIYILFLIGFYIQLETNQKISLSGAFYPQ